MKKPSGGTAFLYQNLPFLFFLGLLGLVYIANVHTAEKKIRQIQKLNSELKELRTQYIFLESENMYAGTQSQMEERLQEMRLTDKHAAPKRLASVEKE